MFDPLRVIFSDDLSFIHSGKFL